MADTTSPLPIEGTIHETLGIRVREASPDLVVLEMPVGRQVHQPLGLLHGGASAVIAESAASLGALLNCKDGEVSMGTDLNISHLRAYRSGTLTASATPIRTGRTMHVWGIELTGDDGRLIAVARCTLAVRPVGSA